MPAWNAQFRSGKRTESLESHYCEAWRSAIAQDIIFLKYTEGNMHHLKKENELECLQRQNLSELSNIAEMSLH